MKPVELRAVKTMIGLAHLVRREEKAQQLCMAILDAMLPVPRNVHPGDRSEMNALREDAIGDAVDKAQHWMASEAKS